MTAIRKFVLLMLFNLLVVTTVFLLCEGLASTVFFVDQLNQIQPVAERLHTRYDPELGWVNIPNTRIVDMYGPTLDVSINGQGFRSTYDFSEAVPAGKVRAICSGDSFTFGFGVNDDETWCARLNEKHPTLETVNMAQGGYGIDQAYLWYARDGDILAHDIHLFAFITADFDRMQREIFLGYGKPLLTVVDDELVLSNVPVSRQTYLIPWLAPHYQPAFDQLRSVQWLRDTLFGAPDFSQPPLDEPKIRQVAEKVLAELIRLNDERGSRLVLVYLPVFSSYEPGIRTETRRRYIGQAAAKYDIIFIDLVPAFRELPRDEVEDMFIPNGEIDFPGAAGHYNARGHEYIATRLSEELLAHPILGKMLSRATSQAPTH